MQCFLAVVLLGGVALGQSSTSGASPGRQSSAPSASQDHGGTPGKASTLPAPPQGKTTVIGGAIRHVDSVNDELTLKVFGAKPIKILFDARTQFYRNGVRAPLRDLHPDKHASIETVLDGTNIYALSIHTLSELPEGECQGQVLGYDRGSRELTVTSALAKEPVRLRVPAGTPIDRVGQAASASTGSGPESLAPGTLIDATFQSSNDGRGVATRISILASPGETFVFRGDITFLDLHAGQLAVTDPRDGKSYRIFFDAARLPVSKELRMGKTVIVHAVFNGSRYEAGDIAVSPSPGETRK